MFCYSIVSGQNQFEPKAIAISEKSELCINGTTNVNRFTCTFAMETLPNHQKLSFIPKKSYIELQNAVLVLKSEAFNCGSRPINKDFKDLIKAEKYPEVLLEVKKIAVLDKNTAKAEVEIFIAGTEKKYVVPVQFSENEKLHIKGKLKLNIQDFGLESPKKLFGAIVVKDEIEIEFNLTVKN